MVLIDKPTFSVGWGRFDGDQRVEHRSKDGVRARWDGKSGPMGHNYRCVLPCGRPDLRIGVDPPVLDSRHLLFVGSGTGGWYRMPRIRTYVVRGAPVASDPRDIDRLRATAVARPNR